MQHCPVTLFDNHRLSIQIELTSFSDLNQLVNGNLSRTETTVSSSSMFLCSSDGENCQETIPNSIRLHIDNIKLVDLLMERAASHWCCIRFKLAPLPLCMVQQWTRTPRSIVYCIASVCILTMTDPTAVTKEAVNARFIALAFYEQARKCMDDAFVDHLDPILIYGYFCLTYTSNVLRLYDQSRTWFNLASIAIQSQVVHGGTLDNALLQCWYRWYYIDGWMSLSRGTQCVLPDLLPPPPLDIGSQAANDEENERQTLYHFAQMTQFMRKFIRGIRSRNLFAAPSADGNRRPSLEYHLLNNQLQAWYYQLHHTNTGCSAQHVNGPSFFPHVNVHLHLCYHSMRLVVLYQFLIPGVPEDAIVLDCLETNLQLLLGLHHLNTAGCDQSTYHHMFLAIHNVAHHIYTSIGPYRTYARDQMFMNILLMRSTRAYDNDAFALRAHIDKITADLASLGLHMPSWAEYPIHASIHSSSVLADNFVGNLPALSPTLGTFVFRLQAHANQIPTRSTAYTMTTFTSEPNTPTDTWADRMTVFDARPHRTRAKARSSFSAKLSSQPLQT